MGVRLRARAMNMCFAQTRSGTLPFLARALKCVQRVIVWCGHDNRQGESVSCVKSAVKSAALIRIHYITCRVHCTQHTGLSPGLPGRQHKSPAGRQQVARSPGRQ
eukprot:1880665-Prymnesium_polylepis.1